MKKKIICIIIGLFLASISALSTIGTINTAVDTQSNNYLP